MQNRNNIVFLYILQVITIVCCILFVRFCSSPEVKTNTIEKSTVYIYDSTKKEIKVSSAPAPASTRTVEVPADVDTAAILKLYFSVNTFTQQIQDSSIRVMITDTVSQNKIKGRKFAYQFLKPIRTIESTTITLQPEKTRQLFIGGFTDYTKTKLDFGPKLSLKTKKDMLIGYEYGALNQGHRISLQAVIKW